MSKERAAQLIDAGIWLRLSGDLEGARKLFVRALKLDPGNERAEQLLQEGPVPAPPPSAPTQDSPFEPPIAPAVAPVAPSVPAPGESVAAPAPALGDDFVAPTTPFGVAMPAPVSHDVPASPASAPSEAAPPTSSSDSMPTFGAGPSWADAVATFPSSSSAVAASGSAVTPGPDAVSPPAAQADAPSTPSGVATTTGSGISSPSALTPDDMDWGRATGFDSPAPFSSPSPRPDDWGAMLEPPPVSSATGVTSTPSSTISLGAEPTFPVRSTPPIFGASAEAPKPAALTVTLDGAAPPPSPIRATPPQFVEPPPPSRPAPPQAEPTPALTPDWRPPAFDVPPPTSLPAATISLSADNAPQPSPPRSTPPLFEPAPTLPVPEPPRFSTTPIPVPASTPTNVDVPLPAAPDPVGVAWSWSTNTPAPFQAPVATAPAVVPAESRLPVPLPSPLTPNATSAWDNRSNPGIKLSAIVGEAKALEMLSSDSEVRRGGPGVATKDEVKTLLRGARDLLDLDDHTGAMELIVKAQTLAPDDPDVKAMRERSEKTLVTMFESKLGKMETVPRVLLKEDEIIWLNLDHRAGFVLAQIDGTVSFDDLFAVSGMSRLDTARILAQLVDEGVISKG
ncbi:MAG: hypothetical protein SFW67_01105 [Myxococcaceae bacterium]|nr:hypothetical protein [Myxococcaceae bacterium]